MKVAAYPNTLSWYVATTYRQAKQIAWKMLKSNVLPWIKGKPNETDLSIEINGGGVIALRGAENYDSLRGPGLNMVVFDEYADMAPEAWTEVIRPALSDRMGTALFIGTPRGYNFFHDMYQFAKTAPDWSAFHFTTLQGGHVPAEEVAAAKHDMDARTFQQEYCASFENLYAGRVYQAFDRALHVKEIGYWPHLNLCWTLDFNVDPMCSVICQIEDNSTRSDLVMGRRSRVLNVIDEIVSANATVGHAVAEFIRRSERYSSRGQLEVHLYGDVGGHARSSVGGTSWQMVLESPPRV